MTRLLSALAVAVTLVVGAAGPATALGRPHPQQQRWHHHLVPSPASWGPWTPLSCHLCGGWHP